MIEKTFKGKYGLNLKIVDARKEFMDALKGEADPEVKRKIIGHKFIEVFEPGGWLDTGPYGCLGNGMGYAIAARVVSLVSPSRWLSSGCQASSS